MRPALAILGILIALPTLGVADRALVGQVLPPPPPPIVDRPRLEPASNSFIFGSQMHGAISTIAGMYFQDVPTHRLAAATIQGLYEAAGKTPPAHLQGDLDKVEKALADKNLSEEIAKAHKDIGNAAGLQGDNACRIGLESLTRALDPYSVYLPQHEYEAAKYSYGHIAGIGFALEDKVKGEAAVVKSVALNSPAEKAGIRPGDELLEINGQATTDLTNLQVVSRLNARSGSELTCFARRAGSQDPRKVTVERGAYAEPTVLGVARLGGGKLDCMLDKTTKIGYARVLTLVDQQQGGTDDTDLQLAEALVELQRQGMRGLILDLRDCPGGSLTSAVQVADLFIKEGVMLAKMKYREDRDPRRGDRVPGMNRESYESTPGAFLDFPIVALIGQDTSGGGELIAAALQDSGRAVLAGQRTRGKASIQSPLSPGQLIGGDHGFRVTSGVFIRPSGKNLQRLSDSKRTDDWGVQPDPDLEIRMSPVLRRQIRHWRLLHDLRPSDSTEALPLDRPDKDPVQFAALTYLRDKLAAK